MEDGPPPAYGKQNDPYMNVAWSHDPILKFWDLPNNFGMKRAIRFKLSADIENGASLHRDHKTTPKWGVARVT